MFRRRPRIEQVENQGSVEPQLVLPAPSGAPLPLHLGLGPQAHLHGNSSSAYWGFPGVNAPREREWKMHQRKQRLPGTWEDPVVGSVMGLAQQLPGTLLGLVQAHAEDDSFSHSADIHRVSRTCPCWGF